MQQGKGRAEAKGQGQGQKRKNTADKSKEQGVGNSRGKEDSPKVTVQFKVLVYKGSVAVGTTGCPDSNTKQKRSPMNKQNIFITYLHYNYKQYMRDSGKQGIRRYAFRVSTPLHVSKAIRSPFASVAPNLLFVFVLEA